jgi:hypothetical protein
MCNFQRTINRLINAPLLCRLPRCAAHILEYAPLLARRLRVLLVSETIIILKNFGPSKLNRN